MALLKKSKESIKQGKSMKVGLLAVCMLVKSKLNPAHQQF